MNKSLYGERDYTSGQHILTLRTRLGLTQMGLASHLGVSRKAVAWWEAGCSYPTAEHLKQLIALGVQQRAFPAGREAEEIRVL
jgi:DNA-binding transcriptional regulator YiaG